MFLRGQFSNAYRAALILVACSSSTLAADTVPSIDVIQFDKMTNKEARREIREAIDQFSEFYQSNRNASKSFEGMAFAMACGGEVNPNSQYPFDLTSKLTGSEEQQANELKSRWLSCARAAGRLEKILLGQVKSNPRSAVGLFWQAQAHAQGYQNGYQLGVYVYTLQTCMPDVRRTVSNEIEAFKSLAKAYGRPQFDADFQLTSTRSKQPLEGGFGSCANWISDRSRYLGVANLTETLQGMAEMKRNSGNYDFISNLHSAEALDDRLGQ